MNGIGAGNGSRSLSRVAALLELSNDSARMRRSRRWDISRQRNGRRWSGGWYSWLRRQEERRNFMNLQKRVQQRSEPVSTTDIILPFTAIQKDMLALIGGKGANLGEMAGAGRPVPPGFWIRTAA